MRILLPGAWEFFWVGVTAHQEASAHVTHSAQVKGAQLGSRCYQLAIDVSYPMLKTSELQLLHETVTFDASISDYYRRDPESRHELHLKLAPVVPNRLCQKHYEVTHDLPDLLFRVGIR